MTTLATRLDRLEKEIDVESPAFIREIARNGPKSDIEEFALIVQRDWKKPGLAPLLECLMQLGREAGENEEVANAEQ